MPSVIVSSQFGVSALMQFAQFPKLIFTAPLHEAVEYEEYDFENPFAHKSPYRGPPTNEIDAAWTDLWFCKSKDSVRSLHTD